MPGLADTITVVEGSVRTRSLVAAYTRAGTLVGIVTINAPKRLQYYTPLIGGPVAAIANTPGQQGQPVLV